MQASTHFQIALAALLALAATACSPPRAAEQPLAPQAVRAAQVRQTTLIAGRSYLAEVVPERSVRVIAQVPGTVTAIPVEEGAAAVDGAPLLRVAAPDVAARVARIRSERKRAEGERDFACNTVKSDRALAGSGDLPSIALERSERACSSAERAVEGATAGEREASIAKLRGVERAPFAGEVLLHLVDLGQTVMPGTPLMQYASRERLLKLRIPESELEGIVVGGKVKSAAGPGRIRSIGSQAMGAGRVVEVLIQMDSQLSARVGTTLSATLILQESNNASAVPSSALGGTGDARYLLLVEGTALRRVDVTLGVEQEGWTAVHPPLAKGTLVAQGAVDTLDPTAPIFVVQP